MNRALRDKNSSRKVILPKNTPVYILSPTCKGLQCWNLLLMILAVYCFHAVPFRLAFSQPEHQGKFEWDWLAQCDLVADVVFLVNIGVTCVTAYVNTRSIVAVRVRKIIKHKFRLLLFQGLICLPLDWLVIALQRSSHVGSWLRLPKMFHLGFV